MLVEKLRLPRSSGLFALFCICVGANLVYQPARASADQCGSLFVDIYTSMGSPIVTHTMKSGRRLEAFVNGEILDLRRDVLVDDFGNGMFAVDKDLKFTPQFYGHEIAEAPIVSVQFIDVTVSNIHPDILGPRLGWSKSGYHWGAMVVDKLGQVYFRPSQRMDASYVLYKTTAHENQDGTIRSYMQKLDFKENITSDLGTKSPFAGSANVIVTQSNGKYYFQLEAKLANGKTIKSNPQIVQARR